jgi:uncharacterized protein (TIGR03084 family)
VNIFDDLEAEQDQLESVLAGLDDAAWRHESGAPGWSVTDVMIHLAQTEEAVVATVDGDVRPGMWDRGDLALDDAVAMMVEVERDEPAAVFDRWRSARRASVAALRAADPGRRVQWAAAPLRPPVLAVTRLAEHWAHALDITGPLGLPYDDTDRLRHIAWLGHRTLPYAFSLAGAEAHDVHCVLTAPDGSTWTYGPSDADSRIDGPAGDFCRIGAQRLTPGDSALTAAGPHAAAALQVLRNYAA